MHFLKVFLVTLVTALALDGLWLGVVAKGIYQKEIGGLMGTTGWAAAILVYVFLLVGLLLFVVPKVGGDLKQALLWGAVICGLSAVVATYMDKVLR